MGNIVRGAIDAQGRCRHYHSEKDIIAIKFKCCGQWYACIHCHEELADHAPAQWPKEELAEEAVMCGACTTALSIEDYLASGNQCPSCGAAFNPGCANHYHYYFEQ